MIELPKMKRYEDLRSLPLDVPETYNFAFDVIDARAGRADKTAFIAVDRSGERIKRHSFSDLSRASNFAPKPTKNDSTGTGGPGPEPHP